MVTHIIVYYISASSDCHNKDHKLGDCKQGTFILSESWRLKVQNQGVGRAALPPKALEGKTSLPLPASDGSSKDSLASCITPISAFIFTWPFPSVCMSSSVFQRHLSWDLGLPTNPGWIHLEILNFTSAKTIFPNKVMFIDFRDKWHGRIILRAPFQHTRCYFASEEM